MMVPGEVDYIHLFYVCVRLNMCVRVRVRVCAYLSTSLLNQFKVHCHLFLVSSSF